MYKRAASSPSRAPLRERCATAAGHGIETSGKYAWPTGLSDDVGQLLDGNALRYGRVYKLAR